ncbi:MAG: hypothetical protein NT049_04185 [Planctomycetota bacterium]|nr:hypothetical protein [Planctomycetota bacterium]
MKYASFGVRGLSFSHGLAPAKFGFVPSPTPASMAWMNAIPLLFTLAIIVLASSGVLSRKSCHWVVPSQKTGSPFWSTKYLPFGLTLRG